MFESDDGAKSRALGRETASGARKQRGTLCPPVSGTPEVVEAQAVSDPPSDQVGRPSQVERIGALESEVASLAARRRGSSRTTRRISEAVRVSFPTPSRQLCLIQKGLLAQDLPGDLSAQTHQEACTWSRNNLRYVGVEDQGASTGPGARSQGFEKRPKFQGRRRG